MTTSIDIETMWKSQYTIFIIHSGSNIYLSVLFVKQSTYYLIGTSLPVMHIPFTALFLSLDVLHPSTSSANSTPSTNSSHPTQGRYQPFVYLLCAIQGACHYSFLWMFLHPSTPSANSSHPTQGQYHVPLLAVSPFCALQGASPSGGTPFSHTSTAPRGYSLHRVPQPCDSTLMCTERVLTTCLTSRHPQNA